MEKKTVFDNVMIATDGSEQSRIAFNLALQFYDCTDLFDKIIVAHVSDKNKTYLPQKWKPDYIYNEYKTELLSLYPSEKYKLSFEEKRSDVESCRDQILKMAESMKVSFLFIGFTGRKGDKENQTVLSQTVKHSAFHSTVPMFIVKRESKRNEQKSKGFTFMACVDGSQKSYTALKMVVGLAMHPNDQIIVCYAPLPDKSSYSNTIKAEVSQQLQDCGRKWEFIVLESSSHPGKTIANFVNTNEKYWINFVSIGNNGYRAMVEKASFFGKTSESVLLQSLANVIIVS